MRRVIRLITLAVLLISGLYAFIYLYRWEWNRAQFCVAVFIAGEVALVGMTIVERLNGLVERQEERAQSAALDALRASAPPMRRHFAWVERSATQSNVFVPILLGLGLVLSALAAVVEKLARATAKPQLERGLAGRLDGLAPPASLVTDHPWDGGRAPTQEPLPVVPRSARKVVVRAVEGIAVVMVLGLSVRALGDAAQTRPDAVRDDERTVLVMDVRPGRTGTSVADAAATIWGVCEPLTDSRLASDGLVELGPNRVMAIVEPALGHYATNKLTGCLDDLTLDEIRAQVVERFDVAATEPIAAGAPAG
jgi:hypothetical protein